VRVVKVRCVSARVFTPQQPHATNIPRWRGIINSFANHAHAIPHVHALLVVHGLAVAQAVGVVGVGGGQYQPLKR